MDSFDAPVCLTRSAPLDVGSGQLVFYDVIDSATVSRCSVLSCIAEAGGEVVLPNNIRLPEFRIWLSATSASSTMVPDLSLASICVVLKVANALDDARLDNWIDVAATRLTQHLTSKEQPHEDATSQQIAQQLSLLSQPLLIRLFTAATCNRSQVQSLLDFWPGHLHQAIVPATVTPTRTLNVCLRNNSLPLVKALKNLDPAAPSVLFLDVHCPEDSPMQGQGWQEAALHLAEALQQHSGINILRLDIQCIDATSTKMLARAIVTLGSLQSLHLHTSVDTDTTITLQQMLQALPQLRILSLSLHLVSASLETQHDASTSGKFKLCLAAMLSPATSLTSLLIQAMADSGKERFVATKPLELPFLSHLDVLFDCPIESRTAENTNCHAVAVSNLLSQLSAPLHHFSNCRGSPSMQSEDSTHARRLYSSLNRFTQLHRLDLCDLRGHGCHGAPIQAAVADAAPPALAELCQLQHLRFTATSATCLATVRLLTRLTGLSQLHLDCRCGSDVQLGTEGFSELFHGMSILPLNSLHLELYDLDNLPGVSSLLVRELTRLTALRLESCICIHTPADVAALASMTRLQKLHLLYADMEEEVHASCVRALQTLPALTSLVCSCERASQWLLCAAPLQAWPALQELGMVLSDPYDKTIMFHLSSNISELPYLSFERLFDNEFEYEEDFQAFLWSFIRRHAAGAGITVSICEPLF